MTNKKHLVVGLGREGLAAYRFLRSLMPQTEIYLADDLALAQLPLVEKIVKLDHLAHFVENWRQTIAEYEVIIKSAGVSPYQLPFTKLSKKITLSSPTQLFFDHCPGKIIGITGTKGKSTTSTAIYHLLKSAGKDVVFGGNIGTPALEILPQVKPDTWCVLELSSHQLQNLSKSPHIAVIQEISTEHLDYYPDVESYQQAKASITSHQNENDHLFYFADSKPTKKIANKSIAQKHAFSLKQSDGIECWINGSANDEITWQNEAILRLSDTNLIGRFNLVNLMPAIMIGKLMWLGNEDIKKFLATFLPLPHRLEKVGKINDVLYVNDSLATTPTAAANALGSFPNQQIILIAGGFDRGLEQSELIEAIIKQPVKHLILFPQTGQTIKNEVATYLATHSHSKQIQIDEVTSMTKAVKLATQSALPGEVVLMSPGAASFNLFKDYEDRGNQFIHEVKKISQGA